MRTLKLRLEYDYNYPIRLIVFSDTHVGHPGFYLKGFQKFLQTEMAYPNSWLLGLGDHLECIIPADLKRFQLAHLDIPQEDPDAIIDHQIATFCNLLEPYKNQILGLAMGNHEMAIAKRYGTNPHRRICEKLGCEDLGLSFLARLILAPKNHTNPSVRSVVIYGHHGWGGACRTEGGNMTKYSRVLESLVADIYLFGHSHDQWVKKKPRLTVDNKGQIQHRDAIIANTGTWKKTLSDKSMPTWEESRGFPPRLLGGVVIEMTPHTGGGWVDLKAM